MKRTWLIALVPITLAATSLLVSAAVTEQGCDRQAVPARDAHSASGSALDGGAGSSDCRASPTGKQVGLVALDADSSFAASPSFRFAPDLFTSSSFGLASLYSQRRAEVSEPKPSLRGKPP